MTQSLDAVRAALKPFVAAFENARLSYSKRYQDNDLGFKNFDKMPDNWPMEKLQFDMGTFRRAAEAYASLSDQNAGDGWLPIEKLTKEHLPALIRGGTYDWSDSWNDKYVSYPGTSLVYYMPDKFNDGAIRGDQCEGHDNYYYHKPEWFYPLALVGSPPLTHDERKDAWASLQMIGDAVEELFGPVANLESEEGSLHRGPEFHHRAEGIIEALSHVSASPIPVDRRAVLEAIAVCAQEWCDGVDRGTGWDYWDSPFKEMKHKLLPKLAALAASPSLAAPASKGPMEAVKIEQVAKALYDDDRKDPGAMTWEKICNYNPDLANEFRSGARAALGAMQHE